MESQEPCFQERAHRFKQSPWNAGGLEPNDYVEVHMLETLHVYLNPKNVKMSLGVLSFKKREIKS